jgi:hypothetical protein
VAHKLRALELQAGRPMKKGNQRGPAYAYRTAARPGWVPLPESVCVTAIDRIDLVVCLPVLVVLDAVCLTLGVTRTLIQVIRALAGWGAA